MNELASIPTPDHGTLEFELAGLGSRFAAGFVDFLLMILLGLLVMAGMALLGFLHMDSLDQLVAASSSGSAWVYGFLLILLFVLWWGYFVFFEYVMRGSSPGKRELGIRVIRDDGFPIGFQEAALRNLLRAADSFPPPAYLLAAVCMHFDSHGRRLGDLAAGTIVVREKFERPPESTTGAVWAARVERGHSRRALTLPGGILTSAQVELIEQFLLRRDQLQPERRDALAWQLAQPLLALKQEETARWQGRPDRTAQCERLLMEVLEKASDSSTHRDRASPGPSSLF